eukprot:3075797-Lingulodinium_polyedra.AAC.1
MSAGAERGCAPEEPPCAGDGCPEPAAPAAAGCPEFPKSGNGTKLTPCPGPGRRGCGAAGEVRMAFADAEEPVG